MASTAAQASCCLQTPTAAGKLFGSSSALGITTTPHCARHHPRQHVCWCPCHGDKVGRSANGGLWLHYLGNAPGVLAAWLPWGFKSCHCSLELFTQGPKRMYKRVLAHTLALGQQLEKTNRKREITELELAA